MKTEGCVDDQEATVVKRIFDEYLGGKSSYEITAVFNREGLRSRKSNPWSAQGILRILQNPAYIGKFRDPIDAKKFVPGVHTAIIDVSTFQRVESIAENTRSQPLLQQNTA
ncbi:MAG: recombinase family protein [bacterium]|nr:recombinase family protein [bacterium]